MDYYQVPIRAQRIRRVRSTVVETAKFLALFLFFFTLSALVVMGPTLYAKISYYVTAGSIEKTGTNKGLPVSSPDYASIAPTVTARAIPQYPEPTLVIPKISVEAPIILMETTDNKSILDAIQNGVAHYAGTALPGRVGNAFITGHSSYYWWSGGKYNQVFALLEHLQPDDLIYVYYEGGEYVYQVQDSIVVKPTQTEVLNQTPTPTLSLMTCVPIGTNLNRLIVRAELISTPPIDQHQFDQFIDIPPIPTFLPL